MRGLKSILKEYEDLVQEVAPLAGAWIEISIGLFNLSYKDVAPLAGAWIEI